MGARRHGLWTGTETSGTTKPVAALLAPWRGEERRGLRIWAAAAAAFAVLHTLILVGAAVARTAQIERMQDAYAAALAAVDRLYGVTTDPILWVEPFDAGAVLTQTMASTAAFATLLGVALLLVARRHRLGAGAAVAAIALSTFFGLGVLAETVPFIPVPQQLTDFGPRAGLDPAFAAAYRVLDESTPWQDTPWWWRLALALAFASIAAAAVVRLLRRTEPVPDLPGRVGPAIPSALTASVLGLAVLQVETLSYVPAGRTMGLALAVGLMAVVACAAAATCRLGTAFAISAGFALTHALLWLAFNRPGGAPGGWGVGSGGPEIYATATTAAALLLAPLLGWGVAVLWSQLRARGLRSRTAAPAPA